MLRRASLLAPGDSDGDSHKLPRISLLPLQHSKEEVVLRIAVVALVVIWGLALFTKHTVLLVLAVMLGLISIVRGRNP